MLKKLVASVTLAVLLIATTACTSAQQAIVTLIASSFSAVEQFYAADTGNPINQSAIDTVNGAAQLWPVYYSDWENAPAADKATAWGKVVTVGNIISSTITQELRTFHVTNPASQAKITALVTLLIGQLDAWAPVFEGGSTPTTTADLYGRLVYASLKSPHAKTPKTPAEYVKEFNRIMAVKTGNKAGDSRSKILKIHNHSLGVRVVTGGIAK